jgi:uncharacterized protein (DUF433 family)
MGIDVLNREIYTIAEAARLLRVSPSTLRWWLEGRDEYPPVVRPEASGSGAVTWGEFVEAGFLREYRKSRSLQRLRPVIDKLRDSFGVPYPLAHFKPFVGPGLQLTLEAQQSASLPEDLTIVYEIMTGQLLLAHRAHDFIQRVDFAPTQEQWAVRMYPAGRESPVVIDPEFSFGAPSIRGIKTAALAELVEAGEPPEAVADDFSLELAEVKAAVSYEWQQHAA